MNKVKIRRVVGALPLKIQKLLSEILWFFEWANQSVRVMRLKRCGMKEFNVHDNLQCADKECHILASGWSLNHSFELIERSKSFVIGFNFSFLKCPDPDLHFIENASDKNYLFFRNTIEQYCGLERFGVFNKTRVIFKNLSEFKNSLKIIMLLYSGRTEFVKDKHYRVFGEDGLSSCLDDMFKQADYLPQMISSVVSMIFLARMLGFKRIVIHGLDFSGPHFYGKDPAAIIFDGEAFLVPQEETTVGAELHKTAIGGNGIGVPSILNLLKSKLEKEGVELLAAHHLSPSAKILGSFLDNVE